MILVGDDSAYLSLLFG